MEEMKKISATERRAERERLNLLTPDSKPPVIEEHIGCDCRSSEHCILVVFDDWFWDRDPMYPETISVQPHLTTGNLWFRIKQAWRYVSGKDIGRFDDILLNKERAMKLRDTLTIYIEWEDRKAASLAFDKETQRLHEAGLIDHYDPTFDEQMGR